MPKNHTAHPLTITARKNAQRHLLRKYQLTMIMKSFQHCRLKHAPDTNSLLVSTLHQERMVEEPDMPHHHDSSLISRIHHHSSDQRLHRRSHHFMGHFLTFLACDDAFVQTQAHPPNAVGFVRSHVIMNGC